MTDTERERINAICEVANVKDIDDLSDGFHTFNSLYEQRMMLFAALVKAYKDKSWKSYRHEDGEYCFGGGWFVVGIDTPEGSYTYHYENKYWDMFDCVDLPRAKHWDGHTEKDVTRLLSLPPAQPEYTEQDVRDGFNSGYACGMEAAQAETNCSEIPNNSDAISRQALCEYALNQQDKSVTPNDIMRFPSVQPEQRYTEEELRVFLHGISLRLLSKRSAQYWRYDEDTAKEIEFLERLYEKVNADMRGGDNI